MVVSPDELNEHLGIVIVAPMTTGGRSYPWRPRCRFQGRAAFVALDQLRTVDTERLLKRLGQLGGEAVLAILQCLQEMFADGSGGARDGLNIRTFGGATTSGQTSGH